MKIFVFLLALLGVVVMWGLARLATIDLRAQLEATRDNTVELTALRREQGRMERLQHEAEERARNQHATVVSTHLETERAAHEDVARSQPTSLIVGEWLPISAWRNRGQTTPSASVETTLWAAAGGDVETLKEMLQVDELVRAKADAVVASLPASSRAMYPSAEHLIAAFTTKSVPLGDAQLVWQHQLTSDEAVACVFVKNEDVNISSSSTVPLPDGTTNKVPSMGVPSHKRIATYLSLRRTDDGWRLVVPMSAIEKIANELGRAK